MDEFERMVEAARQAQGKLTGVAGEGSILEQISRGEWNGRLQPEQARDLARCPERAHGARPSRAGGCRTHIDRR